MNVILLLSFFFFRYPVRWTPEEIETWQVIKDIVGVRNLQNNGIVIMTNGEAFSSKSNFEDYVTSEMKGFGFGEVLSQVTERLFVNYDMESWIYKDQEQQLWNAVSSKEPFSLYQGALLNSLDIAQYYIRGATPVSVFIAITCLPWLPLITVLGLSVGGPLVTFGVFWKFLQYFKSRQEASTFVIDENSYDWLPEFKQEIPNVLTMKEGGEAELNAQIDECE